MNRNESKRDASIQPAAGAITEPSIIPSGIDRKTKTAKTYEPKNRPAKYENLLSGYENSKWFVLCSKSRSTGLLIIAEIIIIPAAVIIAVILKIAAGEFLNKFPACSPMVTLFEAMAPKTRRKIIRKYK